MTLGDITASDLDLMGAMTDEELLGVLEKASQPERKAFLQRIKKPKMIPSGKSNSRGEFEDRMHLLPQEIQNGLARKNLQAVDAAYYVTKNISDNKIIKMLKDDDTKIVGISNVSGAKFEKGNIMLLSGIILLASVGVVKPEEGVYDVLTPFLRNGEFEFKANGTTLIPITSCEMFNTTGTVRQKGLFKLDNPKMIYDQQSMELNVEWGSNVPDNTFMKVILVGTAVTKY
jgi:hypothetical protein